MHALKKPESRGIHAGFGIHDCRCIGGKLGRAFETSLLATFAPYVICTRYLNGTVVQRFSHKY
jgi:hypothetical protein